MPISSGGAAMMRYSCVAEGCGKSFQRKEHLVRHQRTHDPETLCICQVCNKKFNRSDSLQRHLGRRHGQAFQPSPSKRSKRACLICHAGKIKCNGDQPCLTCLKKGLECRYRQEDVRERSENLSEPSRDLEPADASLEPASIEQTTQTTNLLPRNNTFFRNGGLVSSPVAAETSPVSTKESSSVSISIPPPSVFQTNRIINWLSVEVRRDPEINQFNPDFLNQDSEEAAKYLECYFDIFHVRWPIIHRFSYSEDFEKESNVIKSSMVMTGAWVEGSPAAKQYAVKMHNTYVDLLLSRLSKVSFQDHFQQSVHPCLFQAALVNVIFALYSGDLSLISRACILRTMLLAALREVGFFNPDAAWTDEKSGYFLALRLMRREQRQRLAAYFFKIDTYLNLLQYQPSSIMLEELHFSLPSSFALFNSNGLDVWEERQVREFPFRIETSLFSMLQNTVSESMPMTGFPLLIEDLQLCMCSMQSSIWKLSLPTLPKDCRIDLVLQKDSLRKQLSNLKLKLDQMANQNIDSGNFGDESCMPLRQYFGLEGRSQPGWEKIVMARVKCLFFDASMLYQLFSLHLHADVPAFTSLAKSQILTTIQEASERYKQGREEKEESIRKWIGTPTSRQALCHAVDILHAHQSHQNRTPDPIAYIALSTAALVVWAYYKYSQPKCDLCFDASRSNTLPNLGPAVELTSWTTPGHEQEQWRESFIEMGESCRIKIQGIQLCRCNHCFLMALFKVWLPTDWQLSELVAPGIFNTT